MAAKHFRYHHAVETNGGDTGTKSDETNIIEVTLATVGDFCKVDSAHCLRAPTLRSTIFRMKNNNLYICVYYEFYNLQRLMKNPSQRIGTHCGIFSIFVINTWDHVSHAPSFATWQT